MRIRAGANIFGSPAPSKLAMNKPCSIGSQTMMDVPARLKDLDNYGIDMQVTFATTLLTPLTEDLAFEAANCAAASDCRDRRKKGSAYGRGSV